MAPHFADSRTRTSSSSPLVVLALASTLVGCSASGATAPNVLELWAAPNHTINASVGQELALKIQTIGPGGYDSIPVISSLALSFLDAEVIGVPPAGATLRFRFRVVAPGTAVVVFHFNRIDPILPDRTVEDTVIVH